MVLRQTQTDIIDFARDILVDIFRYLHYIFQCSLLEFHTCMLPQKTTIFETESYTKQRHKEQNN